MKSCQILVDSLSFTWIARLRLSGLDHQRVWHRPRHGGRVKTSPGNQRQSPSKVNGLREYGNIWEILSP
jgi:hypothetical protein